MLRNKRYAARYRLKGLGILTFDGFTVTGELVDISSSGIAIWVDRHPRLQVGGQVGQCRIESVDLPAPVTCFVSLIRIKQEPHGHLLACRYESIDDECVRMLKAFRALAHARARRMVAESA